MFETRALQLEVVKKPDATEEPRVVAHIYADDECSPVAQVFAIPLSRVRVVVKAEFGSPYCSENWGLKGLMDRAVRLRQNTRKEVAAEIAHKLHFECDDVWKILNELQEL